MCGSPNAKANANCRLYAGSGCLRSWLTTWRSTRDEIMTGTLSPLSIKKVKPFKPDANTVKSQVRTDGGSDVSVRGAGYATETALAAQLTFRALLSPIPGRSGHRCPTD